MHIPVANLDCDRLIPVFVMVPDQPQPAVRLVLLLQLQFMGLISLTPAPVYGDGAPSAIKLGVVLATLLTSFFE